ncbi:MAG: 2-C-methyl-D-erythritol 4-phosphate cytidylyltransferase [Muribaculaceae bacterium]|nr:2-C-methyl-D-erythritol 4-phosphate cytidylyltransferase [Muribaculaceae bacterium]MBR1475478.1 2-C-methyl-D-erythritol 4-phosphate cytidylyltransferase [Muribaculaceae bacterium]MBR1725851.1 2-C-methyl-D-erythritol 4-phosphate cytidylyltransferase [Muribaculaceae bacterium]
MRNITIIVAGGSGTRFAAALPKQFVLLAGRPVLLHTLEAFAEHSSLICVVLPEAHRALWRQLCDEHRCAVDHRVVTGGDTRWRSVKNALDTLTVEQGDVIAVHDGVRPLVPRSLVQRAFDVARECGSAVPVVPVTDSIRQVEPGGESHIVRRDILRAVQTPQAFDAVALKAAYQQPYQSLYTDDASVYEMAGHRVTLIDGCRDNIKLTHPADLLLAQSLMNHE